MNLRKKYVMGVTLFALAVTLSASTAKAQQVTFKLPFEAHWGKAVLAPGDYSLTPQSVTSGIQVFTLTGSGKTYVMAPATISYGEPSDRSYLELVNRGGTYSIAKFSSGLTGKTFRFEVPKSGANGRGGKATAVAVTETNHK